MLGYLTLIFSCQLAGELLAAAAGLPVPGPVCGMLILLSALVAYGRLPSDLGAVADALLGNLSLLFVPAGVGVMLHAGLLGTQWLPVTTALVASTALTIAVTAIVMSKLARPEQSADQKPDQGA